VECPLLAPYGASDSELPLLSIRFSSPELRHSHSLNPCDSLDVLESSSEIGSDLTLTRTSSTMQLAASNDTFPSSLSPDILFDPPFPTSSPITVTTPSKGGLHSYFPTLHHGVLGKRSESESSPLLPPPSKHVHIQPPPSPQLSLSDISKDAPRTLNKPGKSAANKQALNTAVKAGTFKRDKHKWEKFKSKISEIDRRSEVDDDNPKWACDILHVKCGKVIRMATVYDVSLFKRHVQICKSHTAQAGMHTLDRGLNFVFLQQDVSSSLAGPQATGSSAHDNAITTWPCPGLSGEVDPLIENYLLRTTVPSAGGTRIENVAHDMFSQPYKDLTDAEKHAVRIGQMHTHRWSLEHQQRCIFTIGIKPCLRKVPRNARSPQPSQPCDACSALLKDRAFRTAIYRTVPNDENRKFTPHLYQAAEIAKISAKHSGLGAIFDKVGLLHVDATPLLTSRTFESTGHP
jgi:hypothetical protein